MPGQTYLPSAAPSQASRAPSQTPTALTAAPTAAPTSAPTHPLGSLVTMSDRTTISENDAALVDPPAATLLTVNPGAVATEDGETITVRCERSDDIAYVDDDVLTIDASGVVGARAGFEIAAAWGAWDAEQLVSRTTMVECEVASDVQGKPVAMLSAPVTILGVAQPSAALFCPHNMSSSALEVDFAELEFLCASGLTTNGGARIVVLGASCATCPTPPFGPGTRVNISGIACETTVSANGSRLEFTSPTIDEMEAHAPAHAPFALGAYVVACSARAAVCSRLSGARYRFTVARATVVHGSSPFAPRR